MKEYDVVCGYDLRSLVRFVDKKLAEGWELVGGVSVDQEEYIQAVCREIPDDVIGMEEQ